MDFTQLIEKRRSIRKYTSGAISEENIKKIVRAGLLAPSSRNLKSAEFIVIKDREVLKKLKGVKSAGSGFLDQAAFAVAVIGDSEKADAWIEDCSLALIYMQLAATELGIGSCWIQCRLRQSSIENVSSEQYAREILGFADNFKLEAIMSFGMPDEEKPPCTQISEDKIHII